MTSSGNRGNYRSRWTPLSFFFAGASFWAIKSPAVLSRVFTAPLRALSPIGLLTAVVSLLCSTDRRDERPWFLAETPTSTGSENLPNPDCPMGNAARQRLLELQGTIGVRAR